MGLNIQDDYNLLNKDYLNFDDRNADRPSWLSTLPTEQYSRIHGKQRYDETGNILDFLGGFVSGGLDTATFGLIRADQDPNDMNMMERMGSGLGNIGALFIPYGGLGKVANLGARGLSQGSRAITKKAIKKIVTDPKYSKIGGPFPKGHLEKELQKQLLKDKTTKQWISRHGMDAVERQRANRLLVQNVESGLRNSFKKAGQPIDDKIAREIAETVGNEMRKPGRHINTMESWIESAIGRKFPKMFHGGPAKYIGMAAQDFYLFGAHTAISRGIGAGVHGDQYTGEQLWDETKMNIGMSLLFPAARLIPWGGQATLRQGVTLMKEKFKTGTNLISKLRIDSNYKKMIKTKKGQKHVRGLLAQMTRGADQNAINTSLVSGKVWKVKGKNKTFEYGPDQILTQIDNMPIRHVVDILEQYQGFINGNVKEWAKGYGKDFVSSIPRMIAGSMVMNIPMIKDGYYERMRTPELFQHFLVGALMTKSRGLWDMEGNNKTQWSKDFNNYLEMYNYLNMEPGHLKDMVDIHTGQRALGELYNLTAKQTKAGSELYDIINPGDRVKNSQLSDTQTNYEELDITIVKRVEEAVNLANHMHLGTLSDMAGYEPINVRALSKQRIMEIYDGLKQVKVGDTGLLDLNFRDFLSITKVEVGENIKSFYMKYIEETAKATGLDKFIQVDMDRGRILYSEIGLDTGLEYSLNGKHPNSANKFVELLRIFEEIGVAKKVSDVPGVNITVQGKGKDQKVVLDTGSDKDVGSIIDSYTERYMGTVVRSILGEKNSSRFNFLGLDNNMYLNTVIAGHNAKIKDKIYRLTQGKTSDDPIKQASEEQFLALTKALFRVNSEYTKGYSPGGRTGGLMINRPPKIRLTNDDIKSDNKTARAEAEENMQLAQEKINEIYDWFSAGNPDGRAPGDLVNEISLKEANYLIEANKDLGIMFPNDRLFEQGFVTEIRDYVARRSLETPEFTEASLAVAVEAKNNGLFDMKNKEILNREALELALKKQGIYSEREISGKGGLLDKYDVILAALGKHPAIKVLGPTDLPVSLDDLNLSRKSIQAVYDVSEKGAATKIYKELITIKDNIGSHFKTKDLVELGAEIDKVITDFTSLIPKGIVPGAPGMDEAPQRAIETLQENVDKLLNRVEQKIKGNALWAGTRAKIELAVENLVTAYNTSARFDIKNNSWNIGADAIMNVGEAMDVVIKSEEISHMRINQHMAALIALHNSPTSRGNLVEAKTDLMIRIAQELNNVNVEGMSLNDAINEFVTNRSVESLDQLLFKVNRISATKKSINEYKADVSDAKFHLDKLLKAGAAHSRNNTPMKLMKKYGLQDVDDANKIDGRFIDLVKEATLDITDGQVRDYIYRNLSQTAKDAIFSGGGMRLTDLQRASIESAVRRQSIDDILFYVNQAIRAKYSGDANSAAKVQDTYADFVAQFPVLIRQAATKTELTSSYTIQDGVIEVDHAKQVNKTLGGVASTWMEGLNLIGIGQLTDNIIINGKATQLNHANGQGLSKKEIKDLMAKADFTAKDFAKKVIGLTDRDEIADLISENFNKESDTIEWAILDMTAGAPLVLPVTEHNLKQVNDQFVAWRENKIRKFPNTSDGRESVANFEKSTEFLLGKNGVNGIESKMLMMNLDVVNAGKFDELFSNKNWKTRDRASADRLYQKMLKYSSQAVNDNFVYLDEHYLSVIRDTRGVSENLRFQALRYGDEGVGLQIVADETYAALGRNLHNAKDATRIHLEGIRDNESLTDFERAAARENLVELDKLPSLDGVSIMDGAGIIVDDGLRLLMGSIMGDKDGNGFKNNIAYGDNFMSDQSVGTLVKGYFHKNPLLSNIDLGNTSIVIGESAAKSLYGRYMNQDVVPLQLNGEQNLVDNLKGLDPNNTVGKIVVPFKSIGFGYMAETSDKVLASNSLSDNMPQNLITANRIWKGLETKVKLLSEGKDNWKRIENEQQALQLFQEAVDQTGYDFTDGGYSLAAIMLKNGAMSHHNPTIRKSVNSLFNSKIFSILRRNDVDTGSSSLIVPDIDNSHVPTMFRTVKQQDLGTEEIQNVRSRNQAEDNSDFSSDPTKVFRVVSNFGEMSFPKNLGDKVLKRIEDVDMVLNYEGRDIRFRVTEKGDIELTDHLFDVINKESDRRYVGESHGDEAINSPLDNQKFMSELKSVGEAIKTWINDPSANTSKMTNAGLLHLLETGSYEVINRDDNVISFKSLDKKLFQFVQNSRLGLGMTSIAIPKKSFDVGFNRVKQFLSKEWGSHMIGNNHDIRVMHQRDNDGDKMYTYYGQDSQVVDWGIRRMGLKMDYKPYERHTFDANPLGLDSQGNIGAVTEDVGFTHLKNQVAKDKFAIGEAITLKNVLNWANNIGFEIKIDYPGEIGKGHKVGFTNLSDIDGIVNTARSLEYETANQQGDINQTAVDYWEPSWISGHLKNIILFGELPQNLSDKAFGETGKEFRGAFTDSGPFRFKSDDHRSELDIRMNQEIADIMLGTLKKAYSTFTDPFDDGGQFSPTDWYINKISGDLETLLQNPNEYIVGNLLQKFRSDKAMIKQIVDRFYNDGRKGSPIFEANQYANFMKNLANGKGLPRTVQNKVITIKNGIRGLMKNFDDQIIGEGHKNWKELMSYEDAGFALKELKERQLLRDEDYFGELTRASNQLDYNQIVTRTGNLMNRVMLYKAYFDADPSTKMDDMNADDYFALEVGARKPKTSGLSFENIEMRSAAYHLLNKEANGIMYELSKMDGDPFKVNKFEVKTLNNRLDDLTSSMKVLEKMSMKNLLHKDMFVDIVNVKGRRAIYTNYSKQTTHMYGIKGSFSKDDLANLDFSNFRYFGGIKSRGSFKAHNGWTYVEVKRPLMKRYFGDSESVHAFSLYKAISKTLNVSKITDSARRTELFDDLWVLTQRINDDFSLAKDADRAYKNKGWEFASIQDEAAISQFMKKWGGESADSRNVFFDDGDVGLELMKLVMLPNPVSGAFVKVEGFELPYLAQNHRMTGAMLSYLKSKDIITADGAMPESLELIFRAQRKYVKETYGYKFQDEYLDQILDSHVVANDVDAKAFDRAGEENANIIRYLKDEYDFIDPSVSQRMIETNTHGPIYDRYDIDNKKIRFVKNKHEVWGCS